MLLEASRNLAWLEKTHNVVQRFFPSETVSGPQPRSAVFTEQSIKDFNDGSSRAKLMCSNLSLSWCRWLPFLGMKVNFETQTVSLSEDYVERVENYAENIHNCFRISRMLASVSKIDAFQPDGQYHWEVAGFYRCLVEQINILSEGSEPQLARLSESQVAYLRETHQKHWLERARKCGIKPLHHFSLEPCIDHQARCPRG